MIIYDNNTNNKNQNKKTISIIILIIIKKEGLLDFLDMCVKRTLWRTNASKSFY